MATVNNHTMKRWDSCYDIIRSRKKGNHLYHVKSSPSVENSAGCVEIPCEAKGLNSDTRELLETQKNLMNTLKEMGPVLTQGKDIMNTFNKYFGSKPKV